MCFFDLSSFYFCFVYYVISIFCFLVWWICVFFFGLFMNVFYFIRNVVGQQVLKNFSGQSVVVKGEEVLFVLLCVQSNERNEMIEIIEVFNWVVDSGLVCIYVEGGFVYDEFLESLCFG